eukprot:5111485-Amphidinium_carterae.1
MLEQRQSGASTEAPPGLHVPTLLGVPAQGVADGAQAMKEARRLLGIGDGGGQAPTVSQMLGTGKPKGPPQRPVSSGGNDNQDALLQRL